jgi:ABC-type branched-subunit amino acid transport system substrate-binding protein
VVRDSDEFGSDRAFQSTDELLAEGVSAIIGPATSGVTLSIIDQIVEAGAVLFSPSNSTGLLSSYEDLGLYFRSAPADSLQGRALAELIVSDGVRRLGVISRDDSLARGLTEPLLDEAQALGIAEGDILTLTYTVTSEFRAQVAALGAFRPEGVVVIGGEESVELFRLLNEAGIGPRRETGPEVDSP